MNAQRQESCAVRLKKALYIRGMRQADLMRITKIPKSSMSEYLSGNFEPKQDRIYILAKALNVSEAWLMGFDVPMERDTEEIPPKSAELSDGEKMLLKLFKQVPEDKQKMVIEMIRVALKTKG